MHQNTSTICRVPGVHLNCTNTINLICLELLKLNVLHVLGHKTFNTEEEDVEELDRPRREMKGKHVEETGAHGDTIHLGAHPDTPQSGDYQDTPHEVSGHDAGDHDGITDDEDIVQEFDKGTPI